MKFRYLLGVATILLSWSPMQAVLANQTSVFPNALTQNQPTAPTVNNAEGLLDALNTSPEQEQKIQVIRQEYQEKLRQQQEQLRQLQQQLSQLMVNNVPESELRQKHNQFMQVREEIGETQFDMMLKMRAVLTPEQRSQLAEIMQQRRLNSPRSNR